MTAPGGVGSGGTEDEDGAGAAETQAGMPQRRRGDHSKSFRIALAGCGRIARTHFQAIARVEGLTLSAVCDTVAERAQAAGDEFQVPWFTSYEQMLREAPCEVVAICTPSGLHPAQGILAAQHGKHVVSEKPMTGSFW